MKEFIYLMFSVFIFTSCQNAATKFGEEIDNKKFYDITNAYTDIYFVANKDDKASGLMKFENLTSEGYVTTNVSYKYQIIDSVINVEFLQAEKGEIPYFKSFKINKTKENKIGSLITNLNGEIFIFISSEAAKMLIQK